MAHEATVKARPSPSVPPGADAGHTKGCLGRCHLRLKEGAVDGAGEMKEIHGLKRVEALCELGVKTHLLCIAQVTLLIHSVRKEAGILRLKRIGCARCAYPGAKVGATYRFRILPNLNSYVEEGYEDCRRSNYLANGTYRFPIHDIPLMMPNGFAFKLRASTNQVQANACTPLKLDEPAASNAC